MAVMKACKAAGVRRVCMTSSTAAITYMDAADKPQVFDESHWSNVDWSGISAYEKAKTLAERAAWDFVAAQPENERIELSVINPSFILGPTLIPGTFSSGYVIGKFMNNDFPGGCPYISKSIVDVRNVAQAHVNAIKSNEAQGKRFVLTNYLLWLNEIGDILHEMYGSQGYTIPRKIADFNLVKKMAKSRPDAAKIVDIWGIENVYNNERSKRILGIEYIDIRDSIREMAPSMIEQGIIPDRRPRAKL